MAKKAKNDSSKVVKIRCKGAGTIALKLLNPIQGNLKVLHEQNYEKLRNEIADDGFKEPISIWDDPKTGKIYVLNGHQRLEVLTRMQGEGWKIPQIPVSFVEAKDMAEAKRSVLPLTSQYGVINPQTAFEYITELNVDADYVNKYLNFSDFDTKRFVDEFFEKKTPATGPEVFTDPDQWKQVTEDPSTKSSKKTIPNKTGEISSESFQQFEHKCPRCSFEFD
jgi:hypothetical protein